ncbi:hypothetical protein J0X15_15830 [Roseibium sp. CAU 1637]|uniref:Uncharacterized protein n=1 Tax=Roseibium limicola TaxID=2816037 RepID=A0A939ESA9_9HYPH|nr:hypothetical protein [Roseibium limicola]MBO0346698.1 hypothetical protein [Roseibium limicola]
MLPAVKALSALLRPKVLFGIAISTVLALSAWHYLSLRGDLTDALEFLEGERDARIAAEILAKSNAEQALAADLARREVVAALEAAQAEADAARERTSVAERAILETAPEDDRPVATVLEVLRKHRLGGVDE